VTQYTEGIRASTPSVSKLCQHVLRHIANNLPTCSTSLSCLINTSSSVATAMAKFLGNRLMDVDSVGRVKIRHFLLTKPVTVNSAALPHSTWQ